MPVPSARCSHWKPLCSETLEGTEKKWAHLTLVLATSPKMRLPLISWAFLDRMTAFRAVCPGVSAISTQSLWGRARQTILCFCCSYLEELVLSWGCSLVTVQKVCTHQGMYLWNATACFLASWNLLRTVLTALLKRWKEKAECPTGMSCPYLLSLRGLRRKKEKNGLTWRLWFTWQEALV